MSLTNIAIKTGLSVKSLEDLISGNIWVGICSKFWISQEAMQNFLTGSSVEVMARKLWVTQSELEELRNTIWEDGAKGLIIWMLLKK